MGRIHVVVVDHDHPLGPLEGRSGGGADPRPVVVDQHHRLIGLLRDVVGGGQLAGPDDRRDRQRGWRVDVRLSWQAQDLTGACPSDRAAEAVRVSRHVADHQTTTRAQEGIDDVGRHPPSPDAGAHPLEREFAVGTCLEDRVGPPGRVQGFAGGRNLDQQLPQGWRLVHQWGAHLPPDRLHASQVTLRRPGHTLRRMSWRDATPDGGEASHQLSDLQQKSASSLPVPEEVARVPARVLLQIVLVITFSGEEGARGGDLGDDWPGPLPGGVDLGLGLFSRLLLVVR